MPAQDLLCMCRTSLVSPEQSVLCMSVRPTSPLNLVLMDVIMVERKCLLDSLHTTCWPHPELC